MRSELPSVCFCVSFTSVDHPCEKCGAIVEDGRPFCPQCRAPQIHVQMAVTDPESSAPASGLADTTSFRLPGAADFERSREGRSGRVDQGVAMRSALKAGALGGVIGVIAPPLGVVLAGTLAVFFFRREKGFVPPVRIGWRLGAVAGVVSFAIDYGLMLVQIFVQHAQQDYIQKVLKMWQDIGANTSDPAIQASIHILFTPLGLVLTFVFGMIFPALLAGVSGAISAKIMAPRTRR